MDQSSKASSVSNFGTWRILQVKKLFIENTRSTLLRVYTKDSESILDGYGQPLIGTSTSIKMAKINSKFEPMIVDFYA